MNYVLSEFYYLFPVMRFILNIVTGVTLSRVFLVPFIILTMLGDSLNWKIFSALLFVLASLTDFLDGWLARRMGLVSDWGKIFDPVADKVLVTSILVALIPIGMINPYLVIILLARDTFVGGLRSLAAARQLIIDAKPAGKWKTAIQMIAIPALIVGQNFEGIPVLVIGQTVLWLSVLLSLVSGIEYAYFYHKASKK